MRLHSLRCRRAAGIITIFMSAVALDGISRAAAQDAASDVAYVEAVSGRVVAFVRGAPVLLDALDIIAERTRLDLQASSELRICHYRTQRLIALTGPARASVATDGVIAANGTQVGASQGTCNAPVFSDYQGGLVARGLDPTTTNVSLQPSIKVVNRGRVPIRKIALWDGTQKSILATFDRQMARPTLSNGQSYLLVVERSDGSELRMILKGSAAAPNGPLFVMVQ